MRKDARPISVAADGGKRRTSKAEFGNSPNACYSARDQAPYSRVSYFCPSAVPRTPFSRAICRAVICFLRTRLA